MSSKHTNSILKMTALVMAFYFMCVAGGVNVCHFCCKECQKWGKAIFLLTTCDDVHAKSEHHDCDHDCDHHHAEPHEQVCLTGEHFALIFAQTHKHCDIEHFDMLDLDKSVQKTTIPVVAMCDLLLFDYQVTKTDIFYNYQPVYEQTFSPPGRAILNKISVLII